MTHAAELMYKIDGLKRDIDNLKSELFKTQSELNEVLIKDYADRMADDKNNRERALSIRELLGDVTQFVI